MGKEILTVHIGSFGDGVGRKMWQNLTTEHGISMEGIYDKNEMVSNNNGKDMSTYFLEGKKGKNTPRALFIDTDYSTIEEIKSSEFKDLFSEKSLIQGNCQSSITPEICINSPEFCTNILEQIRKATEKCDDLQGINVMSSIYSGLGSGLLTSLVPKLVEDKKSVFGVNLLPSNFRNTPLAIYNSILSFPNLSKMDFSLIYDNSAALEFVKQYQTKIEVPDLYEINTLISQYYNFFGTDSGEVNVNTFTSNMILFPSLKLLTVGSLFDQKYNIYQRSKDIFFHPMISVDHRHGRFISLQYNYRGNISENDLLKVFTFPQKYNNYFSSKYTNQFKINFNKRPVVCYGEKQDDLLGANVVANGSSISEKLKTINEIFNSIFRRKAWVHYYVGQGLDEMEFLESSSHIMDLVSFYQSEQDN